jgi:hypothetical protein
MLRAGGVALLADGGSFQGSEMAEPIGQADNDGLFIDLESEETCDPLPQGRSDVARTIAVGPGPVKARPLTPSRLPP